MNVIRTASCSLVVVAVTSGCGADPQAEPLGHAPPFQPDEAYHPDIDPAELSSTVTNPFLPMPVGASWVIEYDGDEGIVRSEVTVTAETKRVWGVDALVVRDTVYRGDVVHEETEDWFAEDGYGNVWCLGEETAAYEDGELVSSAGSWEAGVDGALPGIVMLAIPTIGASYRQEYYQGEAEDYATVMALHELVSVPAGDFEGCVQIREQSVIDPELDEMKYYCEGVGNVLAEDGDAREELVESSLL